MKKLLAFAIVAALSAGASAAGMKIGVVDMMMLVRNHRAYEPNRDLLTKTEKEHQDRIDAMKSDLDEIQKEGVKLADELRSPMLAQAKKTELENKIMTVQNKFLSAQQEIRKEAMRNQQELSALETRLLKAQAEDLRKIIAKFAEEKDYDLIVDASSSLYAKKDYIVTDEVLKAMGVDPKEAKAKEANEGK